MYLLDIPFHKVKLETRIIDLMTSQEELLRTTGFKKFVNVSSTRSKVINGGQHLGLSSLLCQDPTEKRNYLYEETDEKNYRNE